MSDTILPVTPVITQRKRTQVVVCPPGWEVISAGDQYDIAARAAHVACFTPAALGSFIEGRSGDKRANMRLYIDNKGRKITAIFDDADEGYGALRRDRASHTAEFSEEYMAWKTKDRQWMSKGDFLNFLEDHEADIASPTTAALRGMVNALRLIKKVTWENSVKEQGAADVTLEYKTESDQVNEIKVPELITVAVPVFRDGPRYAIETRLRFDLVEGKLMLQYCLPGTQHIVDNAWDDAVAPLKKMAVDNEWPTFAAQAPDQQPV